MNCHTIRGTAATGRFGPDLTHLMSRDTIASGRRCEHQQNLRQWIEEPDSIKPGALMPAMKLNDQQLDAIDRLLIHAEIGWERWRDQTFPIGGTLDLTPPRVAKETFLEWIHGWVTTVDHKRLGILYCFIASSSCSSAEPKRLPFAFSLRSPTSISRARILQSPVYDAWHHHGFSHGHADSVWVRQLYRSAADRRARYGFPAAQCVSASG